jgi:hypothetical protein
VISVATCICSEFRARAASNVVDEVEEVISLLRQNMVLTIVYLDRNRLIVFVMKLLSVD